MAGRVSESGLEVDVSGLGDSGFEDALEVGVVFVDGALHDPAKERGGDPEHETGLAVDVGGDAGGGFGQASTLRVIWMGKEPPTLAMEMDSPGARAVTSKEETMRRPRNLAT